MVIRCKCQATSKNLCSRKQCSCRSNGLKCIAACGGCWGTECQNCATEELYLKRKKKKLKANLIITYLIMFWLTIFNDCLLWRAKLFKIILTLIKLTFSNNTNFNKTNF